MSAKSSSSNNNNMAFLRVNVGLILLYNTCICTQLHGQDVTVSPLVNDASTLITTTTTTTTTTAASVASTATEASSTAAVAATTVAEAASTAVVAASTGSKSYDTTLLQLIILSQMLTAILVAIMAYLQVSISRGMRRLTERDIHIHHLRLNQRNDDRRTTPDIISHVNLEADHEGAYENVYYL
ncbi:hypothetical protein WMY93_030537 [Mugilogobius chulae]|uniref:Uncharacterized protein n=1 Tax=Mugilogobius chulae TaxID=88201 RepID=A0AAW0MHL9_9GOBI